MLATATLLHPSAEVSSLNLQTFHLLDLALSDLVLAPLRPAQPRRDSSSSSDPGDLDDIVGLCIAMTWLTGFEGGKDATGGRRGEMLMGLAWRMASDRCLSSGKAAEEHRKRVWELVQVSPASRLLFVSRFSFLHPLKDAGPQHRHLSSLTPATDYRTPPFLPHLLSPTPFLTSSPRTPVDFHRCDPSFLHRRRRPWQNPVRLYLLLLITLVSERGGADLVKRAGKR